MILHLFINSKSGGAIVLPAPPVPVPMSRVKAGFLSSKIFVRLTADRVDIRNDPQLGIRPQAESIFIFAYQGVFKMIYR